VVDREESPSQEQIDFLHGKYMAELDALFDQHKDRFGYGNYKLQFGE
jgi:Diacylglycerol acyltransferase